jgi:drug/metabolite transporter (DMT)-like permease
MTAQSGALGAERQNIAAGIGLMLLGFLMFSANDALGKWLAATYTPGQILLLRSIFGLAVLAPLIARAGWRSLLVVERPWLHLLRIVCATIEVFFFYWAVSVLPLADAMTYYLAGPIYVTVLAALVLGEPVGWRRWTAVVAGFLGVVVALQPTAAAFGAYALIAFAGSLIYAVFLVITRSVRGTPDLTMAVWQFVAALIAGAVTAPFNWVPFATLADALLVGLLGIVALVAIVCVNRSLKLAPASVVVPYQNTMIVWAILFGYFVFGDTPGWHLIIGAAIIVAACLYIFFREQKVARQPQPDIISGP